MDSNGWLVLTHMMQMESKTALDDALFVSFS